MTDVIFPPGINIASSTFRYLDSTGVSKSPFGGVTRTAALLGDRVGASVQTAPAGGQVTASQLDRAQLKAFIGQMQGRQNRVMLWDHTYVARGSFPDDEIHANNDFSSGLTGWGDQANVDAVVLDGVYRIIRTINDGTTNGTLAATQAHTLTQFVPYLHRAFVVLDGGLTSSQLYRGAAADGIINVVYANTFPGGLATNSGMRSALQIPGVTGSYSVSVFGTTNTDMPGDFQSVIWMSLARCILADCSPNLLLQSDDMTTTWTNSNSTDAANATVAPDGTNTADSIIEDATAGVIHALAQTATVNAAAGDMCFAIDLKAGTRSWARLVMIESTGGTAATVFFNLATGAQGSSPATGANWANLRAYSTALGNGWWRYHIIARKTSAGTTLTTRVDLATADNTAIYNGDGASLIYAWRAGLSPGGSGPSLANVGAGVPFIPCKTTTVLNSAGTSPTGNQMRVKGLPVSTSGLLLPGDWVEVQTSRGSELKLITSSLNSDGGGCGLLNFSPRLRGTVTDGAPISVNRPMGRFVYTGASSEWSNDPGIFSAATFDLEEAT